MARWSFLLSSAVLGRGFAPGGPVRQERPELCYCLPMPHDHVHDQVQADAEGGRGWQFAVGVALNTGFVAAEVIGGLAANSVALLADAAHNLGDVLGLLLAWGAAVLARRPPSRRRTYGWGRSTIYAALINAVVLLISVGAIGVEGLRRLLAPEPIDVLPVALIAAAGIVINGVTAWLFARGREHDLNLRAAFAHMAGDAGLSAGVVVAAIVIGATGWLRLDPAVSLVIAVVITWATWSLLREAIGLAMDAVPEGVSREEVNRFLTALPGVREVHDLHIWGLSTTDTALTVHLVCDEEAAPRCLSDVTHALADRFGIGHVTVQIESTAEAEACRLRPHDVV
jgi:cobalt-zinc-cadmium efflux system protein